MPRMKRIKMTPTTTIPIKKHPIRKNRNSREILLALVNNLINETETHARDMSDNHKSRAKFARSTHKKLQVIQKKITKIKNKL